MQESKILGVNFKKLIKYLLLVFLILLLIPFIIYFYKFGDFELSNNQSVFNDFGGFIAGTTGLIVGIFNILATIILALIINEYDNKRNKDNLDLQKNIFIRSLKQETYNQFNKIINSNKISPYQTNEYIDYLYDLNFKLQYFYTTHSHVIENISNDSYDKKTTNIITQIIIDLEDFENNRGQYYKDKKNMPQIFKDLKLLFFEINNLLLEDLKKPL